MRDLQATCQVSGDLQGFNALMVHFETLLNASYQQG